MRPERATPENKGAEAGLLGAHGMSLTEHLRQRADIKKIFARLTIGIRVGVLRAWGVEEPADSFESPSTQVW